MSQETLIEEPKMEIRILDPLKIPDSFDNFPTGNDLIDKLEKFVNHASLSAREELNELNKLRHQVEFFNNSEHIIFNLANFGLGDAVMQLSYANATAREFENKKITILVPKAIAEMQSLSLSPNIKLFTTIDDAYGDIAKDNKGSVIIQLLRGPAEKQENYLEASNRFKIPRKETADPRTKQTVDTYLNSLEKSNRWIMPIDIRFGNKIILPYDSLGADLVTQYKLENYSQLDFAFMLTLKLLNIKAEKRDVMYPILSHHTITQLRNKFIDGWLNKDKRQAFPIVIATDAGEYSVPDSSGTYDKSVKSSSATALEDAFRELQSRHPGLKIAFIPGKKHIEYSKDVFSRLTKYYPNSVNKPANSLDEMVGIYAAGHVAVTWDSVTRWIVEAMMRTIEYEESHGNRFMPPIAMVTFHNGGRIPYDEYGPREIKNVYIVGDMPIDPKDAGGINQEINIPGKIIAGYIDKALSMQ